ncbi:hypothetical protein LCGC14_0619820, partial [marine sediment metagenome]
MPILIDNIRTLGYLDANYLKIDGSNANVTINIGSQNLTTTGTGTFGTVVIDGTTTINNQSLGDSSNTFSFTPNVSFGQDIFIDSDSNVIGFGLNSPTPDYTIGWDGNDAVHTVTAGQFQFKGGYVHIGDAGTVSFADGDGDLFIEGELEVSREAYFDRNITFDVNGSGFTYVFRDNANVNFGTSNDVRFIWKAVGANAENFLIITKLNQPGSEGNIVIMVDGGQNTEINLVDVVDPHFRIQSSDTAASTDFIQFWHDQTDGNIEVGAGDLNLKSAVGFEFQTAADTDLVTTYVGTTNSGVLTWMEDENHFQFADEVIFDVNVGIGTASPQELLHVGAGTDASDITATDLLV